MLFCCPKCKGELTEADGRAVCLSGHSYDKSKYGYYNLLLSQAGGVHGDNRDMIDARATFLSLGYYAPLRDAVCETVLSLTQGESVPTILDCGAGEGYYTDGVERALHARDGDSSVWAFDISKDAIRAIRRRNTRIKTAVFGSYDMPVPTGTVSLALAMFSPNAYEEIGRTLKYGGYYIMVIPAEEHLFELKSELYDKPYKNVVEDTALSGYELVLRRPVRYKMELSNTDAIMSLFAMTPYAYRTARSGRERLSSLSSLTVTADFLILAYKKKPLGAF